MAFPQASDYRPPIIPDGEIYDNPENGKSYYWTQILLPEGSTPEDATSIGGYWTVVCDPGDPIFVLKAGDTMTGTLEIANEGDTTDVDFDPDKANLTFTTTKTDGSASESVSIHQNGYNSSIGVTGGVVADGSYYSQSGRYYGSDPSGQYFAARPPRLQLEELEGTLQWNDSVRVQWGEFEGALQWDDSARVQWNEFNVEIPKPVEDDQDSDGLIIRGTTAIGYETTDPDDQDGKLLAVYHNADTADAVNYRGKINAANNLVNKGYVDDKDELLRQDIIELEEEIDAIAPSLEYGTWKYEAPSGGNVSRPPASGTFYLISGGVVTNEYSQTTIIKIHNNEYVAPGNTDPVDNHTWADADVGELIQLFDAADPDFFLGKITAKNVDSIGEFVTITADRVQSSGTPDDNPDPITGEFLTRVNIFKEPSGGNASDFVLKNGDEMTGELNISTEQPDGNPNYSVPSPKDKHLRFTTTDTTGGNSKDAYLFQPGYTEDLMTSRHFMSGSNIYTKGTYLGFSSTGGTNFLTFPPRLNFQNSGGGLYWSGTSTSNRRVYMNSSGTYLYHNGKISAKWTSDGFYGYYQDSLKFATGSGGTTFHKPIYVHGADCRIKAQNSDGNSSGGTYGTAGQVLTSQGAAPPRWKNVPSPTYTITKSNGNYYVS